MNKNRTRTEYLRIYRKVIGNLKHSILEWDLKGITQASSGGSKLGAFILGSCFIDHLTCYYFGGDSTRTRYKEFCERFLPRYNSEDLYTSIRCKLVHNYSAGGNYLFTHNHSRFHLTEQEGKTVINLNSFINDLKKAAKDFFLEVENNEDLKVNLARCYLDVGTMSPYEITFK